MPRMLEESLEVALRLARDAAREVMKVYATEDFGVETKADGSPVTRADKAANASILRGLSRYFPADTVLSEETPFDARSPSGAGSGWSIRSTARRTSCSARGTSR
jgi:3'-phosphoadenosine 5'-phosphosulfate (PAPS) 3'-phosphatase